MLGFKIIKKTAYNGLEADAINLKVMVTEYKKLKEMYVRLAEEFNIKTRELAVERAKHSKKDQPRIKGRFASK